MLADEEKLNEPTMLKKSYFHQPGNIAYTYETIPERIQKLAEEKPDKIAMVVYLSKDERYEITRKELYEKSLQFAQVLIKLGIKKGDRVAYCVSNCIDWMVYDVGIMMAGAVSVHLLMGSADVKVTLTGCVMVILDSKERWDDFVGVAEIHPGGKVSCNECLSLKLAMAVDPKSRPANALLASELMAEIKDGDCSKLSQLPVLNPEDIALVNQTSGTTGIPKKVTHTHFNIVNNFTIYSIISKFYAGDIVYSNRPMAYVGGYPIFYLGTGCTTVTGDVRFLNDPANNDFLVSIWKKEKCSIILLLPQFIKSIRDYGFRTRFIVSGGDMITEEMIRHSFIFTDAFSMVYGSTETILCIQEIFTKENVSEHQQGMLGRPFPGMETKIIDEKEEVVEIGKVGTLCIRNVWNTEGYDGNLVTPIKNGWFHTNDLCYMQSDGRILMTGRKSGFIIKGTVNVPIQLIEDYVGSHPDVEQVVVVGVPDSRFGEDICACVRIASGCTFDKNALKAHCEKKMSSKSSLDWISMVPSYFLNFEQFSHLSNGKLNRNQIKNTAIQRLKEI